MREASLAIRRYLAGLFGSEIGQRPPEFARMFQPPEQRVEIASWMGLPGDVFTCFPRHVSRDCGPRPRPQSEMIKVLVVKQGA